MVGLPQAAGRLPRTPPHTAAQGDPPSRGAPTVKRVSTALKARGPTSPPVRAPAQGIPPVTSRLSPVTKQQPRGPHNPPGHSPESSVPCTRQHGGHPPSSSTPYQRAPSPQGQPHRQGSLSPTAQRESPASVDRTASVQFGASAAGLPSQHGAQAEKGAASPSAAARRMASPTLPSQRCAQFKKNTAPPSVPAGGRLSPDAVATSTGRARVLPSRVPVPSRPPSSVSFVSSTPDRTPSRGTMPVKPSLSSSQDVQKQHPPTASRNNSELDGNSPSAGRQGFPRQGHQASSPASPPSSPGCNLSCETRSQSRTQQRVPPSHAPAHAPPSAADGFRASPFPTDSGMQNNPADRPLQRIPASNHAMHSTNYSYAGSPGQQIPPTTKALASDPTAHNLPTTRVGAESIHTPANHRVRFAPSSPNTESGENLNHADRSALCPRTEYQASDHENHACPSNHTPVQVAYSAPSYTTCPSRLSPEVPDVEATTLEQSPELPPPPVPRAANTRGTADIRPPGLSSPCPPERSARMQTGITVPTSPVDGRPGGENREAFSGLPRHESAAQSSASRQVARTAAQPASSSLQRSCPEEGHLGRPFPGPREFPPDTSTTAAGGTAPVSFPTKAGECARQSDGRAAASPTPFGPQLGLPRQSRPEGHLVLANPGGCGTKAGDTVRQSDGRERVLATPTPSSPQHRLPGQRYPEEGHLGLRSFPGGARRPPDTDPGGCGAALASLPTKAGDTMRHNDGRERVLANPTPSSPQPGLSDQRYPEDGHRGLRPFPEARIPPATAAPAAGDCGTIAVSHPSKACDGREPPRRSPLDGGPAARPEGAQWDAPGGQPRGSPLRPNGHSSRHPATEYRPAGPTSRGEHAAAREHVPVAGRLAGGLQQSAGPETRVVALQYDAPFSCVARSHAQIEGISPAFNSAATGVELQKPWENPPARLDEPSGRTPYWNAPAIRAKDPLPAGPAFVATRGGPSPVPRSHAALPDGRGSPVCTHARNPPPARPRCNRAVRLRSLSPDALPGDVVRDVGWFFAHAMRGLQRSAAHHLLARYYRGWAGFRRARTPQPKGAGSPAPLRACFLRWAAFPRAAGTRRANRADRLAASLARATAARQLGQCFRRWRAAPAQRARRQRLAAPLAQWARGWLLGGYYRRWREHAARVAGRAREGAGRARFAAALAGSVGVRLLGRYYRAWREMRLLAQSRRPSAGGGGGDDAFALLWGVVRKKAKEAAQGRRDVEKLKRAAAVSRLLPADLLRRRLSVGLAARCYGAWRLFLARRASSKAVERRNAAPATLARFAGFGTNECDDDEVASESLYDALGVDAPVVRRLWDRLQ
ncbi:hypothetical protein DIPPA_15312 [Diplonema papillatum]|nr:hypothetical protein DIPPA_15312 [Diplonema papillatum]